MVWLIVYIVINHGELLVHHGESMNQVFLPWLTTMMMNHYEADLASIDDQDMVGYQPVYIVVNYVHEPVL